MAYKVGDVCRVLGDCDGIVEDGSIGIITETEGHRNNPLHFLKLMFGGPCDERYPFYEHELELIKQE